MKIPFKALFLVAATSAAVSTSQAANGDLLAGFDHGSGNTLVVNIGAFTSLFNGETWNLNAQLVAAGFTPGQNITFGVIGYQNAGSTLYSTVRPVDGSSDFNGAKSSIGGMASAPSVQARNGGTQAIDWFTETESHFSPGTWFANTLTEPNGGTWWSNPLLLERTTLDTGGVNSFGTFGLGNDGVLTYNAVPEPSTLGLVAGMGLLTLSFRRKSLKA